MRKFLSSFTAFRTRYYRSETGAQSQKFLLGQVEQIAASNKDLKVDVREFKHPWGQHSIIARFEPESSGHDLKDGNSTNGIIILGAHQGEFNFLRPHAWSRKRRRTRDFRTVPLASSGRPTFARESIRRHACTRLCTRAN